MFLNPQQERVDCCAMVCCGIFQSDRDRYLLQGISPPSPMKRFWVHIVIPIVLFFMAGFMALNVPDGLWNEIFVLTFLVMFMASIVVQCSKGRGKRMDIRKDVLWYKYQLAQHHEQEHWNLDRILDQKPRPKSYDEDDGEGSTHYYYQGQTRRDIGCAHPICFLCGCYPNDRPTKEQQSLLLARGDTPQEESLCSCLFRFFCGTPCCGHFCQLGGVCGMAQESREIEAVLLPPAYRRLDYVSMQPMLTYFTEIYNQRWRQFHTINTSGPDGPRATGPLEQWPHLSGLSKTILRGWLGLTVFLGIWSVVGPLFWTQAVKGQGRRHYFAPPDFVIYLASWMVGLSFLALVLYWSQRHRPLELSVDSMIKYLCSGFLLSTTLAIFYENIIGLVLRLSLMVYMVCFGIDIVEDNEYNMEWVIQQPLSQGFASGPSRTFTAAAADEEKYLPVFGRDHPFIYSIYLFLAAFVLAATTEEICKYFGFRMIESPDFLTQKDLEDAARAGAGVTSDECEEPNNYKRYDGQEENPSSTGQTDRRLFFPHHGESLEAQGAAITVAMICVALGFAMCEDLIYIFFYNGSSVEMESYVLIARTLFPIHPIAAAMQSIGIVERDVEKCPTRFGRILLPAILFHGTYDFLLLWIDFLASLRRSDGYEDSDEEALEVGAHALLLSYALSFILMGSSVYYFLRESKKQRERLAARDAEATVQ